MSKKKPKPKTTPDAKTLRQRAEELLQQRPIDVAGMSTENLRELVDELRLHQIEMEIQNEELRETHLNEKKRAEDTLLAINAELKQAVGKSSTELHERLHEFTLLGSAVANLTEGVLITDDELDWPGPRIRFVNEAMSRITGYRAEEMIGQTPRMLQGKATDRDALALLKRELKTGNSASCQVVNYRKDGTAYHVELFVAPVFDHQGKRTNFVSIHRDLTERTQNQQLLKDGEHRLSAILNAAVDAIITINPQGLIEGINPATETLFGYTREELIGTKINRLMPPPYCDEHDAYLQHYLETGIAKIIGIGREVEGRRKDGSIFPIDLAISEVEQLGLFTGIIRDITERKAEQARLLQSERLALLGEAMAGLTHESRNALARSQANLRRLARRLKDNQPLLDLIDGAIRANDDIWRQFEEVREYAKPLQLRREKTDLSDLVNQAWQDLAPQREGRAADMRTNAENGNLFCEGDTFLLRNAFRNLLDNTLAACVDPVEIDVEFSTAQIGELPVSQLMFHDNGPGLPAEVKKHAFEAFYTTKMQGTGLGLAIVKRTIEAHGGEVKFASEQDGGAMIIITLPRKPLE